jgi:hypothetical protein
MKRLIASAFLAALTVLPACRETPSGNIIGTGTLYKPGGECGGTWLVHSDEGREYELTNLPATLQRSGIRVKFTLKKRADVVSTCMRGQSADVVSMKEL